MPDSLDSTFDAFLKALLNVSQRVSFGTKDQGVQIKASPVLKLCPGIGQEDTRGARKGSAAVSPGCRCRKPTLLFEGGTVPFFTHSLRLRRPFGNNLP